MNINDADQMRRLVCAFVVRMQQNQVFSRRAPYFEYMFGLWSSCLPKCTFISYTSRAFAEKNDVDFVSASSKCLECSETADSFEFLLLAHAIKTNVGCASTSSKCTYVLNANSKGPGETAHLRKCAESSELLLLAYAIKANVDCVSTCTE